MDNIKDKLDKIVNDVIASSSNIANANKIRRNTKDYKSNEIDIINSDEITNDNKQPLSDRYSNYAVHNKNKTNISKNTQLKRNQLNSAINFIEELSWIFDSKKLNILRSIPDLLKEKSSSEMSMVAGNFVSPNPNKHFLVGVLPRLFQDKKLFPTNEDIADFARSALNLQISRFEKRSKYELIGLIICETNELNDSQLSELVSALASITGSQDKLDSIIEARRRGTFSWNEAIKKIAMTGQND